MALITLTFHKLSFNRLQNLLQCKVNITVLNGSLIYFTFIIGTRTFFLSLLVFKNATRPCYEFYFLTVGAAPCFLLLFVFVFVFVVVSRTICEQAIGEGLACFFIKWKRKEKISVHRLSERKKKKFESNLILLSALFGAISQIK